MTFGWARGLAHVLLVDDVIAENNFFLSGSVSWVSGSGFPNIKFYKTPSRDSGMVSNRSHFFVLVTSLAEVETDIHVSIPFSLIYKANGYGTDGRGSLSGWYTFILGLGISSYHHQHHYCSCFW
jgi:hypothetical protein